uniref:Secreted protein n=1 Tax=Cacopsylla melanoneura TaxID=428564 RepID=A0A8D8SX00_9HEMI
MFVKYSATVLVVACFYSSCAAYDFAKGGDQPVTLEPGDKICSVDNDTRCEPDVSKPFFANNEGFVLDHIYCAHNIENKSSLPETYCEIWGFLNQTDVTCQLFSSPKDTSYLLTCVQEKED